MLHDCDHVCRDVTQTVCGSNGETYKTQCLLKLHKCISGGKLYVAYDGPCKGKITRILMELSFDVPSCPSCCLLFPSSAILSPLVPSHPIFPYITTSFPIPPHLPTSCPVSSHLLLSYHVLPCLPILSHLFLSCRILFPSCSILSVLILLVPPIFLLL